jgi:hypothetical protein
MEDQAQHALSDSDIAKLVSIVTLCLINIALYLTLWRSYIRPKCILPYQDPNYQAADHNVFKPANLRWQLVIFMIGFIGAPIFILLGWLKVPGQHCFLFQLCFLTNAALYPLLLLQCMWSYRLYYRQFSIFFTYDYYFLDFFTCAATST